MDVQTHNAEARPLTERQQRLLLRAVVGSLVLSAALASAAPARQSASASVARRAAQGTPRVDPQPFRQLLARVRRMAADGQLKADDHFTFTIEAARNADGSLANVRFSEQAAANGRWGKVAAEFVGVLSDSRALSYLEGVERLTLTVSLGERFAAELAAEAASDARAAELASATGLLLLVARDSQQGRPGVEILNNMRASASGKRLLMKLDMTRAEFGNLLSTTRAIP